MIKETNNIEKLIVDLHSTNVFFTPNYRQAEINEGFEFCYLYSDAYVLPVRITKKLFFKYAFFPTEPYKYSGSADESLQHFLDEVSDYLSCVKKIHWINENDTASLFMACPKKSLSIPFGSHVVDLTLDEETLWKNVHSKHRNVIKKAERDGVTIVKGVSEKLINDYHIIDVETWNRSNKNAKDSDVLGNRIKALKENAVIYMAYKDEIPQSGGIFYYNNNMCYYMLGANCDRPHTGAGNLLQWTAMLDMKQSGVQKYSFVGCRINEDENSKYHGIQRFKERFGGELVQGYLFKEVFNKKYYLLFQILLAVRIFLATGKFTMPKDVIDQEIHKWIER